jgi:hypothetical protein
MEGRERLAGLGAVVVEPREEVADVGRFPQRFDIDDHDVRRARVPADEGGDGAATFAFGHRHAFGPEQACAQAHGSLRWMYDGAPAA